MIRFKAPRFRRIPGVMNKLEVAYDSYLSGCVDHAWKGYEALRLRLAPNCTYTPDFAVLRHDGSLEFHEVKGGIWKDDARVKIKVAAETFPFFKFVAVTQIPKKHGGGWKYEQF